MAFQGLEPLAHFVCCRHFNRGWFIMAKDTKRPTSFSFSGVSKSNIPVGLSSAPFHVSGRFAAFQWGTACVSFVLASYSCILQLQAHLPCTGLWGVFCTVSPRPASRSISVSSPGPGLTWRVSFSVSVTRFMLPRDALGSASCGHRVAWFSRGQGFACC